MQCEVKIRLLDKQGFPFMGIGILWLMERVHKFHSIRKAAQDMGMSYPKAVRMIRMIENGIGRPMVVRRRGGNDRGGASLTPYAEDFIRRYDAFQSRVKQLAKTEFLKAFPELAGE